MMETPPNPLEKDGYRIDFHDEFDAKELNLAKWIPYYLPHWSSRTQSAPHYTFRDGCLVLQIDEDQLPWCPEFDGLVKCSSLQTGLFAGAVGSPIGQHRFKEECIVREAQPTQRLYTPHYGYFETRMKVNLSPHHLAAFWLIGLEESPEQSGEITMFEVFGSQMTQQTTEVRYGIKPLHDPHLIADFYHDVLPLDARAFHVYAVEWMPDRVDFYVDNQKRRTIQQSPDYPMQFMMNIYELPPEDGPVEAVFPQEFIIDYVRAYQPLVGYGNR